MFQPHNNHLHSEPSLIYVRHEGGGTTPDNEVSGRKTLEKMGGEDSGSPQEGVFAAGSAPLGNLSLSWRREGERKLRPAALLPERGKQAAILTL